MSATKNSIKASISVTFFADEMNNIHQDFFYQNFDDARTMDKFLFELWDHDVALRWTFEDLRSQEEILAAGDFNRSTPAGQFEPCIK